jgi:hypothetical protein
MPTPAIVGSFADAALAELENTDEHVGCKYVVVLLNGTRTIGSLIAASTAGAFADGGGYVGLKRWRIDDE